MSAITTTPLIDALEDALDGIVELLGSLSDDEWQAPTRCPGWTVHDQVAHVVSVEEVLAGAPLPAEAPESALTVSPVGRRMQRGVHANRDVTAPELTARLNAVAVTRIESLRADPPAAHDTAPGVMGGPMPASTQLVLRAFDIWAHEQDIRAAVGVPGHVRGPASDMAWMTIADNFADVVTQAGVETGQSVVLRTSGARRADLCVVVGSDAAQLAADLADATAVLELDWMDLVARVCGRYEADHTPVRIAGDPGVAGRVLAHLTMTP